jgi:hypothetical protein
MFALSKAADLKRLAQGGQLYTAYTFIKASLVLAETFLDTFFL